MRSLPTKNAEPTVVRRTRVLRYGLGPSGVQVLAAEPRRALAILRALELEGNGAAARTLLRIGGMRMEPEATPIVGINSCEGLAKVLREKGYPLTDRGVKLFKMEHGFSGVVRIGPDVARAYVRFAGGRRTRVESSRIDDVSTVERRALEILRTIGQDTDDLKAVFKALNLPRFGKDDAVDLNRKHAKVLLAWVIKMSWSFDDDGFKRVCLAAGDRSNTLKVSPLVAKLVRDTILGTGEPEHDYTRHNVGDHVLNARTLRMLQSVQRALAGRLKVRVLRGSYWKSSEPPRMVVKSGATRVNPHQGGGVIDLSVRDMSPTDIEQLVLTLREAGFAAWVRQRGDRPHIHAVAIGDRELSASATWQVRAFFKGRDGRSHAGPDAHKHLCVRMPKWLVRYRLGS
ncbi:MAG: hypothetical protein H7Z43_04360 [Clostridia bacterium]|nr:hypothetical protein [Deltaproteobacteria bacterium]